MRRLGTMLVGGLVSATLGLGVAAWTLADDTQGDAKEKASSRFDLTVREDIFAGFEGDEERLKAGMKKCESVLAEDEKHAEAMVWLGAAEVYQSGNAFRKGNIPQGMAIWQKGLAHMDKAAELEPYNVGVLIPRAAVLMPASRNMPKPMKDEILKKVRSDFERVYEAQKDMLDQLGEHPLGELRMGLADVHRALGNLEESKKHLEALTKELPDTDYSKRASEWLAAKPETALAHSCIGCHTK